MKITDHIYFYPTEGDNPVDSSNAIIITGRDKQIIIDPGTNINGRLDRLINDMKEDGLDIDRTAEIWLTHSHPDHSQMIHDLSKRFGEQRLVRCHPLGSSILSNPDLKKNFIFQERKKAGPYWKLLLVPGDGKKINSAKMRPILDMIWEGISILWRKVTNIRPFFNGEIIRVFPIDIQVMFLPGHAPDEIGFWIPRKRVLITGDLINISQHKDSKMNYKLVLYNFQADLDQALESLKKMKQIEEKRFIFSKKPEILLTPHSAPVGGKEKIQEIFDQLISKIGTHKIVAESFIRENPKLKGFQLVKELAKILLVDGDPLVVEKRFVALATLKSLGVIK